MAAVAAAICMEDEAACAAAECAGIEKLDLAGAGADGKPGGGGGSKRSVYLMDCAPVWGCASTRGRSAEMEDACAAAPRFADVPVRLLASRRDLDGLGLDAGTLRLPAHIFGVFDGHGGAEVRARAGPPQKPRTHARSIDETCCGRRAADFTTQLLARFLLLFVQVANYCRERLPVLLSQELRLLGGDFGEISEVDMKEHWDDLFTKCFQRLDDEVSGQASRLVGGVHESRPVAAENVGSTAVVAVVCSSHVMVANCGDSRFVLCRGKEPVEMSIDHKVSFLLLGAMMHLAASMRLIDP